MFMMHVFLSFWWILSIAYHNISKSDLYFSLFHVWELMCARCCIRCKYPLKIISQNLTYRLCNIEQKLQHCNNVTYRRKLWASERNLTLIDTSCSDPRSYTEGRLYLPQITILTFISVVFSQKNTLSQFSKANTISQFSFFI